MLIQSEKWNQLAKTLEKYHKEPKVRGFRDFLQLTHLAGKYLDARLSTDGINRTQRMIIHFLLLKRGFMTPTEISKITLHSIGTINKSIDILDKTGITKSYSSKKDRRKRNISLTEKGLALAERTIPSMHLAVSEAMDKFTRDDIKTFESQLEQLREQILHLMEKEKAKRKKM